MGGKKIISILSNPFYMDYDNLDFYDLFKPYSPELRGDLEQYLRDQFEGSVDNCFYGLKYFFILKKKKLLVPNQTTIRVGLGQIPDAGYFVNSGFFLESHGTGKYNMSHMGAKKGAYYPNEVLKEKLWSIFGLNLKAGHTCW